MCSDVYVYREERATAYALLRLRWNSGIIYVALINVSSGISITSLSPCVWYLCGKRKLQQTKPLGDALDAHLWGLYSVGEKTQK